jgi:hypothetical protein
VAVAALRLVQALTAFLVKKLAGRMLRGARRCRWTVRGALVLGRPRPALFGRAQADRWLSTQQESDLSTEDELAVPSWAIGRSRPGQDQSGLLDAVVTRAEQGALYAKLSVLERNENIDFDAAEFALGAAHARRHIYSLAGQGDFDSMRETVSPSAINKLRDAAMENPERFSSPAPIGASMLYADATIVAEERLSESEQQVHTLGITVQFLRGDPDAAETGDPAQQVESVWTFERQAELYQPVVADERTFAEANSEWSVVRLGLDGAASHDGG